MSNKSNKLIFFLFIFLFISFFPKKVFAVTLDISNYPSVINSDPFSVDVFVSGASDGKNYLRIDLYKDGTTKYFGETFNGVDWYFGSTGISYFAIDIIDSTASATLQGRFGSPSLTEYLGPGNYKLRIRRYTSSGGSSTTDQTPVDVNIQVATPTPEPTSEPTNTPTSSPTNSPTLTPTPTPVVTKTPTIKPTNTPSPNETEESLNMEVLGIQIEDNLINSTQSSEENNDKPKSNFLPILFIVLGISFVGFSGFAFFKQKRLNNSEDEKNSEVI